MGMQSPTRFMPVTIEPTQEMKPAMCREQQIEARTGMHSLTREMKLAMSREQQMESRMGMCSPTRFMITDPSIEMPPPVRFIKRHLRSSNGSTYIQHDRDSTIEPTIDPESTNVSSDAWQNEYAEAFLSGGETMRLHNAIHHKYTAALLCGGETTRIMRQHNTTHRDHALLSRNRQHSVVAPWSPSGGINEEMDRLVRDWSRRDLGEHDVQIDRAENLLQGVECETTQFALDEVGAVLHDCLELDMPISTLPPRDEVKHVGALSCPPVLPALIAGESHRECREEWEICGLVTHSQQPSEEVDLAGHCGNSQEARGPYDEEGEYCLVAKTCKIQSNINDSD